MVTGHFLKKLENKCAEKKKKWKKIVKSYKLIKLAQSIIHKSSTLQVNITKSWRPIEFNRQLPKNKK